MDLRTLVNITTVMQGLQTLLIGIVVFYFYFTYRKNYLWLWAWSWLFCSFYLFGGAIGFELSSYFPVTHPYRLLNAAFYLSSGYLQAPLLILGSYELAAGKQLSRQTLSRYVAFSVVFGLTITIVSAYLADANTRLLLRISAHALISGASFLVGAFCISRVWSRKLSAGRRLVVSSFLVYGMYQFLYTVLPFIAPEAVASLLIYYILIESILLFWTALGLVVWLLEDERDRALVAIDALQASEALFRQLTENNAAGIFILQDETVCYINPTAANFLAFDVPQLINQSFLKQVHPDFVKIARINYKKLIAGVAVPRGEAKMMASDGSERWVEMTGTRIEFQSKPAVLITGIDITERKQAQEQLSQAQKLESIGMLAGGVAHDFNNMLTGMIGFTELALQKIPFDHPVARNLQIVKDLCDRAADLTKQLLAFARRQILSTQVVDLNEIVLETSEFLRRVIGENVEIEVVLAKDLRFVRADAGQIRQVLTNLALNGRDAMPDGGKLIVATRNVETEMIHNENSDSLKRSKQHQRVELVIKDTGTGMNSEISSRIFEPFFTTKEMGRGTGLGLAIVYGIIKQHNGTISVSSDMGAGSSFVIQLPAAGQTIPSQEKLLANENKEPPTMGETILIAEDEQSIRELIEEILTADGYQILSASDGAQAVNLFDCHRDKISLVITDAIMPKLGGEEVFKTLGEKQSNLRFLFISGYGLKMSQQNWGREVDLLLKPFDSETLRQKVRRLLDYSPN